MTSPLPSYDYVIIGAGSAGCVLAGRLSEDRTIIVLLLEAGSKDSDPLIEIPAAGALLQGSRYDWVYQTEPQTNACQGFVGNSVPWSKGKVVGGSSSINYLGYARGHAADYDGWAEQGCNGWAWEDVLPFFIKSEKNTRPQLFDSEVHGTDGPLSVSDQVQRSPFATAFVKAGKELGYDEIDINSGSNVGFGYMQATLQEGKRCSTSKAFLEPAMKRKNLTLRTNAHVTKLNIEDNTVVGVYFQTQGVRYYVKAEREVILSAGTVASPQILMLSGIGPKDHLKQHGIDCIADLPVGQNLQDHIFAMMGARAKHGSGLCTLKSAAKLLSKVKYIFLKKGVLASNGLEATGFLTLSGDKDPNTQPDLQIMSLPFLPHIDHTQSTSPSFINEDLELTFKGINDINEDLRTIEGVCMLPVLLHPKSRGEIKLQCSDPMEYPLIDPNYLDDPADVKLIVKGLQEIRRLLATKAMIPFQFELQRLNMPGIANEAFSDENLTEYVRHFTMCVYHCVGTCRMGANDDPEAVVDSQLRVRGIERLRVIDASIMPTIISGNTNAPTIMIAEKGADMIRSTANNSS